MLKQLIWVLCVFIITQIYGKLAYLKWHISWKYNNFLHELALSGFQFFFFFFYIHSYEWGGQTLWFSLLVSERQIGIIKRSHTCRWQSGKETRSPDTRSPINFRFPEALPRTTHSGQTASTVWHCAVLTGSTKSLSNFHDCIFQCSSMVYFSMPFNIKTQRH